MNKLLDVSLLARILRLAKPFRLKLYAAYGLTILIAVGAVCNPLLTEHIINNYVMKPNLHMLTKFTALLMTILVLQSLLTFSFTYLAWWLGQNIIQRLRVETFNHIQHLNLRYFDRTPVGTSVTRTINDIETINDIFTEGVIAIIADLLTIIVVLSVMFYQSWKLTLVCLSVLPILLLGAYLFKEGIRKSFTEVRTQVARLNAFLQEHISGMSVVQIFTAEEREFKKFKEINAAHRHANIRSNFYYSVFFPLVEIISACAIGLLVWYGSENLLKTDGDLGMITAFIMFINLLFRPIRMLADKFNTLQMGMVAADRVFKLLDNKDNMINGGTLDAKKLKGEIEFRNVSFAYDEINSVLKNISFHIQAGETIAIVGSTGSGKSSTINLISRLYEFQQGEILIDKENIRDYELYSLRKNIGVVLQDVFLFSGSVFDNITLRNREITLEQVIAAAKICGAHDFIMNLPDGYNYDVMERGATLSMGQRQLISFIRTLIYNPKILVLDEATSSIDTESEMLIQYAMEKLIDGRTSIIIAHRLSTIQKADKILVIEKGELKESGTHEQLLSKGGYYRKLYDMQFANRTEKV